MTDLDGLRTVMKLKTISRNIPVQTRKESTAEHSWSCMMLADYFLEQEQVPIDRMRVIDLLMYHDLVEIEAGDVDFLDEAKRTHKAQNEAEAILSLKTKIPQSQSKKLVDLFAEFEENKTIEAKFAQAIDKLEPAIHLLDHTSEWEKRRFSEKVLNEKKEPFFTEFPSILACWKNITKYLKDNDLIDF